MNSSAGVLGCSSLRYIFPDSCKVFGLFYTHSLHLIHFFLSSPPPVLAFPLFSASPKLVAADFIISGDTDLLNIREKITIPIVSAGEFLEILADSTS
ncbi:hypothetical protein [Planktothrix serta]|uniref:hypothetical protein n=1 Tax=Planktothrix serta TaxID=1678310 RepID=UPI0012DFD68C|nr:hypothetical protein [Planktothrix serta]